MTGITPYTIEHHVEVDRNTETYTIYTAHSMSVVAFDDVMDEIERVVIELVGRNALPYRYLDNELTSVRASRGQISAFDTLVNLRDKLRVVCEEQGEKAVANLSPQLMGLEKHRVSVLADGERREFVVGTSLGWMPRHLELPSAGAPAGPPAQREYDEVHDMGRAR